MEKLNMIVPSKQNSEEMSANEFQEKLYNWLQDQGLISDLRGHLRKQMISVFQDSTTPAPVNKSISYSPKVQALCTLIADFLLQQGNNYTLSVYITEVPVIGQMFAQFSQASLKKTLKGGSKFVPQDVEDILQSLGFIPGSELFVQSLELYENNDTAVRPSEPLLLCIIRSLSNIINRNGLEYMSPRNNGAESDRKLSKNERNLEKNEWLLGVEDAVNSNVNLCPLTCLQEYLKRVHEEELSKVKAEEATKYHKLLMEKVKIFENEDSREKQLNDLKEKLDKDFSERENNLCKLASQLRAQHAELAEKLLYLEIESRDVKERELKIKEDHEKEEFELKIKRSEVELQKKKLNEAYKQLSADKEMISKIQRNLLEKEANTTKTVEAQRQEIECLKEIRDQYNSLFDLMNTKSAVSCEGRCLKCDSAVNTAAPLPTVDKGLQTTNTISRSTYISPLEVDDEMVNKIEGEKRELSEIVSQQRARIEELTMRAAELANQLQDAQIALQLASPNRMAVTTPPITAPPTVNLMPRPSWPPHIGSGEETTLSHRQPGYDVSYERAPSNPPIQKRVLTNDLQRRSRRSALQASKRNTSISVSSDESVSTDEIIQNARIRLRDLNEESNTVQQKYDELKERHNNYEASFSVVFHPEQSQRPGPFDGLKRTNFLSSFPSYPRMSAHNNNNYRFSNQRSFASRFSRLNPRPNPRMFFSRFQSPFSSREDQIRNMDRIGDELDRHSSRASSEDEMLYHADNNQGSPLMRLSPSCMRIDDATFRMNLKKKFLGLSDDSDKSDDKPVEPFKDNKDDDSLRKVENGLSKMLSPSRLGENRSLSAGHFSMGSSKVGLVPDNNDEYVAAESNVVQSNGASLDNLNGNDDIMKNQLANRSNAYDREKIKNIIECFNKQKDLLDDKVREERSNRSSEVEIRENNGTPKPIAGSSQGNSEENVSIKILLQRSVKTSLSNTEHVYSDAPVDEMGLTDESDSAGSFVCEVGETVSLPAPLMKSYVTTDEKNGFCFGNVKTNLSNESVDNADDGVAKMVKECNEKDNNSAVSVKEMNETEVVDVKDINNVIQDEKIVAIQPNVVSSSNGIKTGIGESPSGDCKESLSNLYLKVDKVLQNSFYKKNYAAYPLYYTNMMTPPTLLFHFKSPWLLRLIHSDLLNKLSESGFLPALTVSKPCLTAEVESDEVEF